MEIEEAVDKAIEKMPVDYSIREFLIGHRAEGARCPGDICYARTGMEKRSMCITEYNEEETMQMFKEEGRREGKEEGENTLGKLIAALLASGRNGDIEKAATDENARKILYKEFHIL